MGHEEISDIEKSMNIQIEHAEEEALDELEKLTRVMLQDDKITNEEYNRIMVKLITKQSKK